MKKTTAIASFLFLATLAGGAQAAPMVATKAYVEDGLEKKQNTLTPGANIQLNSQLNGTVEISANLDSVTMHAGTGITIDDNNTIRANYETLQFTLTDSNAAANLESGAARISAIKQNNGLLGVLTSDWGQVAAGERAPASGGDVYTAIQNAVQNLYTAGDGISITDGVIAAKGDTNRNIEVSTDGIGISMDEFDTTADITGSGYGAGLLEGISRVARIEQNDKGEITVKTDKWNEMWSEENEPIRTGQIKDALDLKTNDIIAGRLIRVTEENTTEDELTSNNLGEKNYTINSTLYPGQGITFVDNCLVSGISGGISGTCIALRTSTASALRFNEDGELSLSGLSYSSIDDENAAGVENGTRRIASITQNEGVISVTTDSWVESLTELDEDEYEVPATAKAIVDAIAQSVDPVELTANNALEAANEAAEDANDALQAANSAAAVAAEALEAANNAIPKPDPDECGSPENRCVLTYGLNDAGVLAFEWEVITRATGEQEQ